MKSSWWRSLVVVSGVTIIASAGAIVACSSNDPTPANPADSSVPDTGTIDTGTGEDGGTEAGPDGNTGPSAACIVAVGRVTGGEGPITQICSDCLKAKCC